MNNSRFNKALLSLMKAVTHPRSSLSWVRRGHLAKDRTFVSQTYWFTGVLPRVPLSEVLPGVAGVEVRLPRAFDRKAGTSITAEEACHLGAIARCLDVRSALEIGTWDGNTALVLAANTAVEGRVVTVDLPPDFQIQNKDSLVYSEGEFNLTARENLGRQYQGHPLSSRITQVYGDSAKLDWNTLGGPFNLAFIDGCHSEDYVRSDSHNALNHLAPRGVMVWHDYGMIPEVSNVVDQLAREANGIKVYALEGTRLAIGIT